MTKSDVRLVPTTAAHCEAFFPAALPWRIRALTALKGDEVIGIGGLAMMPDGTTRAFLEVSEENAKKYPITLHKAAQRTLGMARELGFRTVLTIPDTKRSAAERYLARLGFKPAGSSDDGVVWQWQG